jgi:hypothetical protein
MAQPQFDPSRAVQFDLGRGQVALDGASCRVLVPTDLLLELCRDAGSEAATNFGRRLGTECGRRVAERLAGGAAQASVDNLLDHLGGEIALMGLGNLGVERWGKALVMTFEGSPVGSDGDALLGAVLEGALQRVFGRDTTAVKLHRDDDLVRLLIVSSATAKSVSEALVGGAAWGQVVADLHAAAGQRGGA